MGLKQLLTNLEAGTTANIVDSQPFYSDYNNGGSDLGSSVSLFDSPTDLFKNKSFKFGQGRAFDRPNNGFSNEPFKTEREAQASTSGEQSFIESFNVPRGGISFATNRAQKDKERIKAFFGTPKGRVFRLKQTGLQLMNPKIESNFKFSDQIARTAPDADGNTRFDLFGTIDNVIDNGGIAFYNTANRTYNPLGTNTTKQVANNHLGLHFDKSGLLPTNAINNPKSSYEVIAGGGRSPNENFDRLKNLRTEHIIDNTTPPKKDLFNSKALNFVVDTVKGALGFTTPSILYEYVGGPNSILGVGRTQIKKFQNSGYPAYFRNDLKDSTPIKHTLTINEKGYQPFGSPDALINNRGSFDPAVGHLTNPGNPIPDILNIVGSPTQQSVSKFYRENFAHTGNPGTLNTISPVTGTPDEKKRRVPYTQVIDKAIDKINKANIITYNYNDNTPTTDPTLKDFIKFYFDVYTDIVNDKIPQKTSRIQFRAFLESFNDSYNGDWNEFNYAGRAEPFYTYKSFKRSIDFSFKIAAQSRSEIMPLYKKLNYLVSTTAPTYSELGPDNSARMRGTFIKATIGDLLDDVPGFFSNISLSWAKEYPWEIKLGDKLEDDVYQNPHVLDVKCSFTPIHNFIPQTSINNSPFIIPMSSIPSEPTAPEDDNQSTNGNELTGTVEVGELIEIPMIYDNF